MQKNIRSSLQNLFLYTFIAWWAVLLWWFYPQLWLSISSPQHTTISVTITAWVLQWSIQPLDTNLVLYSWIYRTTTTTQPVTISANLSSIYTLFGDITSSITWSITPPSLLFSSPILSLNPWDWIKNISTQIDSLIPMSGWNILLPLLQFWIDTTPPTLPLTIEWPDRFVKRSDLLSFSRNAWFDWWSGIERYVIQLSQEAHFPTAIEFSSTWTSISLAGNSIENKKRFWRLWIIDRLWNTIYSSSSFFIFKGWDSSSLDNQQPSEQTPISDQCNWPDLSNNFFDGICTPLITFPELVIIPSEHQAPDSRPIIDRISEWINNKPLKAYVFPAYDTPHAYTIYEYPVELVYQDIYEWEDREENSGTPVIVYNPRLGLAKQWNQNTQLHNAAWIDLSLWIWKKYDYLYLWYQIMNNSCAWFLNYCPVEPMCMDTRMWCYTDELICTDSMH